MVALNGQRGIIVFCPSEGFNLKLNVVTTTVAFVILSPSNGDGVGGWRDIEVFRRLDLDACLRRL